MKLGLGVRRVAVLLVTCSNSILQLCCIDAEGFFYFLLLLFFVFDVCLLLGKEKFI